MLQGSAVPTVNPTWFLPMPSGWAGKPVPSTALGGPGSPAGCDNFCTAPGPLCQHWQQGTTPTQSCHHLPESCTSTWCFPRATLGSPAPPRRCGTNGRALGCSLSRVSKASARAAHLQGFHTQNNCAGSSPWNNADPLQGSAVSCHTCIMNASFAFSPSELCCI